MASHLRSQLSECIVAWCYGHGKSAQEIAELADYSEHTIYDILPLYRNFGQNPNPFSCQNAPPCILELDNVNYIYSILEANPGLYIDEIQQQLHSIHNVDVLIATIS
ncbi:hypothetical protein BDR06DRAFT_871365 [Suillus hirtellus]|nr:hypothetical protein BDR06DRAFT_871365 [Suillus hirtellus]